MRRAVFLLCLLAPVACAGPDASPPEAVAPSAPELEPSGVVYTADGVEIAYEAAGAGSTHVVLVHCWGCDREFWKHQLEALAASYQVAALDLPGHGMSGAGRESWSILGLSEDVATFVTTFDLERVVLVGHSMGGPVALGAAPLLGERLSGIVLVDTVHDAEQGWDAEQAEPFIAAFEEDFVGSNERLVPMLFPEGADPEIVAWVTAKANSTNHSAAQALMRDFPSLDLAALLSGAGVPVRAVNAAPLGEMIPATAIETNRRYADFDAVVMEGVGHYPMLERPEEFNRLLAAAIEEILATRASMANPAP